MPGKIEIVGWVYQKDGTIQVTRITETPWPADLNKYHLFPKPPEDKSS